MTAPYSKHPITIEQQIALFKQRGLIIDDDADCADFLHNISYYRLGWYCKEFQNINNNLFYPNTTFQMIKDVYITDQRLRNLIAESVDRIEVGLRARLVNAFCCGLNNAFWHTNNKFMQDLILEKKEMSKGYTCPFNHYDTKYMNSENIENKYPFWVLSEFLYFSEISKFYKYETNTEAYKPIRKAIAKELNLTPFQLSRCLHSLSVLRNAVAHHDKIYRRVFTFPAKNRHFQWVKTNKEPFKDSNTFINHYYIIDHILSVMHPNNSWRKRVDELLKDKPHIATKYGF